MERFIWIKFVEFISLKINSRQASKWAGAKDRGERIRQLTSSDNRIFTSGTVPSTGERCHWEPA